MSSLSLNASPLDEAEIRNCTEALEAAALMVEDAVGKAQHQIRLKQLDELRIPCGLQFAGEIFGHTIQGFGFRNDGRVDDHIIAEEQVEVEAPPPHAIAVPPWETAQLSACFDFAPPDRDKLAGLDKFFQPVREPSLHASDTSARKPSACRPYEDDTISIGRKSSAYKPSLSIKKAISRTKTARDPSAQSKKKKSPQEEAEPFHKPVALKKEKMHDDKEYDNNVEFMRMQLARKEVKDNIRSAVKGAFTKPPRPSQMDLDGEEAASQRAPVDFRNLTFDDQGNTMEVKPCRVEKLPRLMGPSAQVREVKVLKQKSSTRLRSRPLSNVASKDKLEASTASGRPPLQNVGQKLSKMQTEGRNVQTVITSARFDKHATSVPDGQLDQCSFNIKDNMRATFGITFSEKNHTDKGPDYEDKFKKDGQLKPRLSLGEYQRIHKKSNMMQQIGHNYLDKQNQEFEILQSGQTSDNPPEIISEFDGINNSNLLDEIHHTMLATDYPSVVADRA